MAVFLSGIQGNNINRFELVAYYKTAGTYTWTAPYTGNYVALIIGGGASGAMIVDRLSISGKKLSGGGSGAWAIAVKNCAKSATNSVIVGAGGATQTMVSQLDNGVISPWHFDGNAGAFSSCFGTAANGGTIPDNTLEDDTLIITGGYRTTLNKVFPLWNFLNENNLPVSCLCPGGGVNAGTAQTTTDIGSALFNGNAFSRGYGRNSTITSNQTYTCPTPTDPGAGGGSIYAAQLTGSSYTVTGTPGKGADGCVYIYYLETP